MRATLSAGSGRGFDVRADRVHPGFNNMLVEPRVFYCLSGDRDVKVAAFAPMSDA